MSRRSADRGTPPVVDRHQPVGLVRGVLDELRILRDEDCRIVEKADRDSDSSSMALMIGCRSADRSNNIEGRIGSHSKFAIFNGVV
jgi:hypothetical protein